MNLNGYILAGGHSSRFGSNKALARINGKSFIEQCALTLRPFCKSVSISGRKKEYAHLNMEQIPDLISDIGPLGGLYSCLKASDTDMNLFLTCDMPYLTSEIIRPLTNTDTEREACIYIENNINAHPFPGIYNKSILPVIEEQILNNDFRLKSLLSKIQVESIIIDQVFKTNFSNINYRDQLDHF